MHSLGLCFPFHSRWRCGWLALVALASWHVAATAAQATQVALDAPLTSLLASGAYAIVGTEEYSNFEFNATANSTGYKMQSQDITVTQYPPQPNANQYGIAFQTNGATMLNQNGQSQDISLDFDITELDSNKSLTSMELMFDGAASGTGDVVVDEVVSGSFGTKTILAISQNGVITYSPQQMMTFPGVSTIHVHKDIALSSGSNGVAFLSGVTQAVDPGSTAVPEPSTIVMLVFGGGGLGLVGWRRRRLKGGGEETEGGGCDREES